MKILYIITGLSTGGAERALYNLLQGGLNTQFDCHVISLSDKGTIGTKIEALGVPVFTLNMPVGRPALASIIQLRCLIKKLQPDLIQGWMYHGNLVASLALLFTSNKPALVWNIRHSLYEIKKEKFLTRQVIRANRILSHSVDALVYNSQLSREQHEAFGFTESVGLVIPNGINCQQFRFSLKARKNIREELVIPKTALVVGHVARFHPIKDHACFLEAAVKIIGDCPNTHFLLCGRGVDKENSDINQLIPKNLQHQFHLLGERADIADLMCAMDILCSSSWSEAFPNVLGEAMAIGLPCVATNVGDSALIIGDCGVVVKPEVINVLAVGIKSLLMMPEKDRKQLGEQARKRIKNNFTLAVIVKKYAELYSSVTL